MRFSVRYAVVTALVGAALGAAMLTPVPAVASWATAAVLEVDPREGGLEIGMGEWAVTLEAAMIRPGTVTFVIHNGGVRTHGFRIRTEGVRGRDRFEMRTRLIPPGGVAELVVQLPPGVYEVDCYVEDDAGEHDELGMENILTVREDAPLLLVSPPVAPVPAVSIKSFAFVPEVLEVKAGTVVVWTNEDPVPHTVVAEDGSFISQLLFGQNLSFSREFSLPGAYQYFCSIHPTMRAQVVVSP